MEAVRVDVLVLGGGVVGCAVLRELSRFDIDVALLERRPDICDATSKANSAIVHSGFDAPPGSLEARLLAEARELWPGTIETLHIPYLQTGALMLALDAADAAALDAEIVPKAARNGLALQRLTRAEILDAAPYVSESVVGGVLIEGEGVIDPFWTVRAYCEQAVRNGARVYLDQEVSAISVSTDAVTVRTSAGAVFTAGLVVNAAGLWADEVARLAGDDSFTLTPRQGQFIITEEDHGLAQIILPVPNKVTKGILVTPIVFGGVLLGPTADDVAAKTDLATTAEAQRRIRDGVARLVPAMARARSVRQFAGLRAVSSTGDYIIGPSRAGDRLLHVAGIRSTGLSASPAIGRYVAELVRERLALRPRRAFVETLPEFLAEARPDEGDVVCLCRNITRGEVLAALRSPLPPTTLDGLKRRTGAMLGDCQGNICMPALIDLFHEHQGRNPLGLPKNAAGSALVVGTLSPGALPRRDASLSVSASRTCADAGTAGKRPQPPRAGERQATTTRTYDLIVVGAGLAALSALRAGAARGATVLVDYHSAPGGFLSAALPAPGFGDAWDLIRAFTPPQNVSVRTGATAVGLLPALSPGEAHAVLVRESAGTAQLRARQVLIACGGLEITREGAAIPGTRPAGVMTPTLAHQLLARGYLPGRRALVYGSSRYAAITAGRLAAAGVETMLVPPLNGHGVPALADGERTAQAVGAARVTAPAEIVALDGFPRLSSVMLRRGGAMEEMAVDTLVYTTGMAANAHWLRGSGIEVAPDGEIVVDAACQTNVPGIYAIGTVVAPDPDHSRSIAMGEQVAAVLASRRGR